MKRRRRAALACLFAAFLVTGCATADSGGPSQTGEFVSRVPGVLTVATYAVPTAGFWEGTAAEPAGGFEDALARALANRWGLARVDVVEVPFTRIVAGDTGGADLVLSGITPTDERRGVLDFSIPYLLSRPAVLVRAGTAVPDVYTAQRLRWAVTERSVNSSVLGRQIAPRTPVTANPTIDVSQGQLLAGTVDAVMLDLPDAVLRAERSGGALSVAASLPGDDDIAAAVVKGSGNAAAVDSAIRRFDSDGTLRELSDRWLGPGYIPAVAAVPLLRTGDL